MERQVLCWLRRASSESTDSGVQEYPAHSCPPIRPTLNHGIGEWGGTPLPENPTAVIRDASFIVRECVETAFNSPIPPDLLGTSYMPPPMQRREERERPRQSQKARKRSVAASPGRPTDIREPLKRPFRCDTCGKRFKQTQGRNRHYREKHNPDLCVLCDVEWGRPYQYRDHLSTHHPDVDPDTVIGKIAGSRCRTACFARRAPQQQALPPAIEQYGWGSSEIGPYPPMLLSPAVAKRSTVTPYAEFTPRSMTRKISPEGAANFGLLYTTYAHNPVSVHRRASPNDWTTLLGAGGFDRPELCGCRLPWLDMLAAHPNM
jgi:hypothetical protein